MAVLLNGSELHSMSHRAPGPHYYSPRTVEVSWWRKTWYFIICKEEVMGNRGDRREKYSEGFGGNFYRLFKLVNIDLMWTIWAPVEWPWKERKNVYHTTNLLQIPLLCGLQSLKYIFSAHTSCPPHSSAHFTPALLSWFCSRLALCVRVGVRGGIWFTDKILFYGQFVPIFCITKGLHRAVITCVGSRVRQSQFPSQLNHFLSVSSGKLLVVVCYPICEMMTVKVVVRVHQFIYIRC